MWRMHLRRHDQAPMTHQRKTGKCQQNDNITRAMRLGGPNGVKDSLVLKKNQGQTNKSAIKIQNSLCVPLQTSQLCTSTDKPNLEEDIKGKASFWVIQSKQEVIIINYHAENGRLSNNNFINSVNSQGQTISYCRVNAPFHNGIDEKRIRDLKEKARNQILNANSRWIYAIELKLRPYLLRNENEISNNSPEKDDIT